jgi:hypothetical protein
MKYGHSPKHFSVFSSPHFFGCCKVEVKQKYNVTLLGTFR